MNAHISMVVPRKLFHYLLYILYGTLNSNDKLRYTEPRLKVLLSLRYTDLVTCFNILLFQHIKIRTRVMNIMFSLTI